MILVLEKKEFASAFALVSRFAEKRGGTLAALSGIALIGGDDGIKLRATNLETGIDFKISGTIENQGFVVLPAQTLRDITSSFSGEGALRLEHGGDTVVITSPGARSTIKTLSQEDFPTLPFPNASDTKFSIPGTYLKSLISTVAPYASPSTVRPELGSVFLSAEGGLVKAVATDSFRLAEKKIQIPGSITPFSILIPAKNALDIIQTIPDGEVDILINEHQCAISWMKGIVTTRLVTISYPDYTQIIPKTFVTEVIVLKKDIESAIKRVSIFSDAFSKIKAGFVPETKKITFSASNSDIGESSESVSAAISGELVELSFNTRYLQAPFGTITSESVTLSAAGVGRPLVIRGVGDATFLYLVMPMNQ